MAAAAARRVRPRAAKAAQNPLPKGTSTPKTAARPRANPISVGNNQG